MKKKSFYLYPSCMFCWFIFIFPFFFFLLENMHHNLDECVYKIHKLGERQLYRNAVTLSNRIFFCRILQCIYKKKKKSFFSFYNMAARSAQRCSVYYNRIFTVTFVSVHYEFNLLFSFLFSRSLKFPHFYSLREDRKLDYALNCPSFRMNIPGTIYVCDKMDSSISYFHGKEKRNAV